MSNQDDKMDIIVEAHLAKETFLAGETLSCKITVWSQSTALTNVQLEESAKFPHNFSGILSPPSTPVTPTKDLSPRKSIREKYFSSIDESPEGSKERLNTSIEEINPSPKQTSKVSHVDLLSVQVFRYYRCFLNNRTGSWLLCDRTKYNQASTLSCSQISSDEAGLLILLLKLMVKVACNCTFDIWRNSSNNCFSNT